MNSEIKDTTLESVKEHEGLRLKAYKCPADKDTVGFGRNFEDVNFSPDEEKAMIDYWHKFHNVTSETGMLDCKKLVKEFGINVALAEHLLANDLERAEKSARRSCGAFDVYYDSLPDHVQSALTQMCFQMGSVRWPGMMGKLKEEDFRGAALEARDSRWFKQTTRRAKEVTNLMAGESLDT